MIGSLLMGLVAGARSMTPLAAVAWLARGGELPNPGPIARLLSPLPLVAATTALAAGEILGDKMRSAPDRIVVPGMAARIVTGAIAGAALASRRDQAAAAFLGAAVAVGASRATFAVRVRAMRRFGQRPTGALEDALVVVAAVAIAAGSRRRGGAGTLQSHPSRKASRTN